MEAITIKSFYKEVFGNECTELNYFFDEKNNADIGHFNVFDIAGMYANCKGKIQMPYNRRTYYKISLIKGKNRAEYADKVVDIKDYAILFATPKVPYTYFPQDDKQGGHFCVFTQDFLARTKTGFLIDELPIFKPGGDFVFQINAAQSKEFEATFNKMHNEITSDYPFKYDLLRNYVIELIHLGQKLKPVAASGHSINAATRIATLFIELLERQFPIENTTQSIRLRTAKDFADRLQVHTNHLNKVLKDTTGKTTTEIISSRMAEEAKILLKQTTWNITEIAYGLGFEEVAHFSNFFKKQTDYSPLHFRESLFESYK
ncbi:MAG: helix-turn-helix transcriptional regulator [Rhizobacter sp.]|nr:helix-turn-helix transcriptional regulator [Ferruginibacter sp.]